MIDICLSSELPAGSDAAAHHPRAGPVQVRTSSSSLTSSFHLIHAELYSEGNVTSDLTTRCFQSALIHLQMLWELMLLGEPVVVMAPSPTVSSETVLALVR